MNKIAISRSTAVPSICHALGMPRRPSVSVLPSLLYVSGGIFLIACFGYFHDALKFVDESGYRSAMGFGTLFAAMAQFTCARLITILSRTEVTKDDSPELLPLLRRLAASAAAIEGGLNRPLAVHPMRGAPSAQFYYNDEETGPFTVAEMREFHATHVINPETPVFREGDSQWRLFKHYPELVLS